MPLFEIEAPDGSLYDIEGDNEHGAVAALKKHLGQSPAKAPEGQWEKFKAGVGMIAADPSLLMEVGPLRIAKEAAQAAATVPGEVMRDELNMGSGLPSQMPPETLNRIDALADAVNPAGLSGGRAAARSLAPHAPAPKQVAADTAERVGLELPAVAYARPITQKLAAGLSDLPIVGAPLVRAADKAREEGAEAVTRLAEGVGNVSPEAAGGRIQEGIRAYKKDEIPALEKEAYKPINEAIKPETRFAASNAALALSESQARLSESAGNLTGATARAQKALEQSGGNLPFRALMDLRSAIGQEMRAPLMRDKGYDESVATRLYGALTDDIREAAREAGGDVLAKQWDDANTRTREAIQQFKSVRDLAADNVSPERAAERVYNLAMERTGSAGKLQQLKATIGPEAWNDVTATAIDRLGRNRNGDLTFEAFSTAYGKMSPAAKNILFGDANRAVGDLAATFDKIKEFDRFRSKSQSANPTNVANMVTRAASIGAGTATLALADAFTGAMTGITMYAGSKWLARPRSANSVAAWSKAYSSFVKRPSESLRAALSERADTAGRVIAAETGAENASLIADQLKGLISAAEAAPQEEAR